MDKKNEHESHRGGYRPNAGRKTDPAGARVTFTVRLNPETLEKLQRVAAARGIGRGKLIDELVKNL